MLEFVGVRRRGCWSGRLLIACLLSSCLLRRVRRGLSFLVLSRQRALRENERIRQQQPSHNIDPFLRFALAHGTLLFFWSSSGNRAHAKSAAPRSAHDDAFFAFAQICAIRSIPASRRPWRNALSELLATL